MLKEYEQLDDLSVFGAVDPDKNRHGKKEESAESN